MRRLDSPILPFALFAGLAGFALAAFTPALFNDSDTYWHIRAGEWMLAHHTVLRADVFSHTRLGAPWDAQEWLAEILMALSWQAGGWAHGWTSMQILFGAAFGATAAIVGGALRKRLDLIPALLTTLLGLACVTGSLLARPHILALPLLAAWTLGLVTAREHGRAPHWSLLLLMPLWANLHGSFAFGLALAAVLGVEAVLSGENKNEAARRWGLFGLAAVATALLTPQFWHGLLFPLQMAAMRGLGHIGEWAPSDFTTVTPFEIALLVLVGVLASGKLRLPVLRILILLGLIHLAMQHTRHQMLLGVCGPLLLAPFLAQTWPAKEPRSHPLFGLAAAAVLILAVAARLILPYQRGEDSISPVTALAHVPKALRQMPVLNDYAFGGYLIWDGVRPFIDSRADLYGDQVLGQYAAITLPDRQALTAALSTYNVRWTIFAADAPVVKLLDAMPGWHRVYGDKIAVVHVKD